MDEYFFKKDRKKESLIENSEEMTRTVDCIKKEYLCDEGETWVDYENSNNSALVKNGFSVKTEISAFQLKYENESIMDTTTIESTKNYTNMFGLLVKEEGDFHEEFEIKNEDDLTDTDHSGGNHNENNTHFLKANVEKKLKSVQKLEGKDLKQENRILLNEIKEKDTRDENSDKSTGIYRRNLLTGAIEVLKYSSQLQPNNDGEVCSKSKNHNVHLNEGEYECQSYDISTSSKASHQNLKKHFKAKHLDKPSENETNLYEFPVKEDVENDFHEVFEIKDDDDLEEFTDTEHSEQNHNEDLEFSNTDKGELPSSVQNLENEEINQKNVIGFNTVEERIIKDDDVDKSSGIMMRNLITGSIEVLKCSSQLQPNDDEVRLKPKERKSAGNKQKRTNVPIVIIAR